MCKLVLFIPSDEDLSALANELGLDGANSGQEPTGSGVGEPSQHREEINRYMRSNSNHN